MGLYQETFQATEQQFLRFVKTLPELVKSYSMSATHEETRLVNNDGIYIQMDMFERYSMFSGSRVALGVTTIYKEGKIDITAMCAGGSRALFFKIDTIGSRKFLDSFKKIVKDYFNR